MFFKQLRPAMKTHQNKDDHGCPIDPTCPEKGGEKVIYLNYVIISVLYNLCVCV